jgi:transposase
MNKKVSSESVVKDIRRRTLKKYSSEEKIRIVLDGIRGEDSIPNLCRLEGIPANLYYRWNQYKNMSVQSILASTSFSSERLSFTELRGRVKK